MNTEGPFDELFARLLQAAGELKLDAEMEGRLLSMLGRATGSEIPPESFKSLLGDLAGQGLAGRQQIFERLGPLLAGLGQDQLPEPVQEWLGRLLEVLSQTLVEAFVNDAKNGETQVVELASSAFGWIRGVVIDSLLGDKR